MNPLANSEKPPQRLNANALSRCGGFSLLEGEFIRLLQCALVTPDTPPPPPHTAHPPACNEDRRAGRGRGGANK